MDSWEGRLARGTVSVFLLILGIFGELYGQNQTGEIRIQVKDPSGAAMEAAGKLENLANGTSRSFRTDSQGGYILKDLPFGRYRLELSSAGFAAQSQLINV